jgi:hypothetical protein
MATHQVAEMTIRELRDFVESIIDERMGQRGHRSPRRLSSDRPIEDVLEEIPRIRHTPPTGTPSVVELLREDRDR